MPNPTSASPTRPDTAGRMLPAVLLLLTVFGPISMDLYLPVLPALTLELGAVTSMAQLTVTACLIGLALGQLIAGPLSDRFGRRMPLLIGVVAYHRHLGLVRDRAERRGADRCALRAGSRRRRRHRHRAGCRPRPLLGRGAHPVLRAGDRAERPRSDRRSAARRAARDRHRLARALRVPRRHRRRHPARRGPAVHRDAARRPPHQRRVRADRT